MGKEKTESTPGAVFLRYFGPTLDALRTLGGSGTVKEVVNQVAHDLEISTDVQEELLPSGSPRFQNQIQWARLYLVREGLLSNSKRGVWALTDAGQRARLSLEDANSIFKKQAEMFRQQKLAAGHVQPPIGLGSGKPGKSAPIEQLPIAGLDFDQDAMEASQSGNYREEVLAILRTIKPDGFERFSQKLLREVGFTKVNVTGKSGDGGIDGYGTLEVNPLVSFKVLFQCKRFKDVVGPGYVRDFRGAMQGRADKGIILTTGTFTKAAIDEASRDGALPIELIDAERLIDLMEKFEFGLEPVKTFQVKQAFFKDF